MEIPKTVAKSLTAALVLALVFLGILWRLTPHIPNFAPVSALALLGGMTLGWRKSIVVVLAAVAVSDFLIGFYPGMQWTWLGFGLIACLGMLIKNVSLAWRIPLGAFGASVLFFLVSNFGTWIASGMYSLDISGFIQCYIVALPFFRATLASDLLFTTLLLSAYEAYALAKPKPLLAVIR